MTDEVRVEAELAWDRWMLTHDSEEFGRIHAWFDAYVAGRESVRQSRVCRELLEELKVERACSAKLVEVIRYNKQQWETLTDNHRNLIAWQKCKDALAEYEAAND